MSPLSTVVLKFMFSVTAIVISIASMIKIKEEKKILCHSFILYLLSRRYPSFGIVTSLP